MNLGQKLLLILFCFVLLPLSLIGYYFSSMSYRTILDNTLKTTNSSLDQIRVNLRERLLMYIQVSNLILTHKGLKDFLASPSDDLQEQLDKYQTLVFPEIERYSVVNPYLRATIFIEDEQLLPDQLNIAYADDEIRNQSWYRGTVDSNESVVWRGIFQESRGISLPASYFSLVRPIHLNEQRLVGILQLQVDTTDLFSLISKESTGKQVMIVNPNNEIITSNRKEWPNHTLKEILPEYTDTATENPVRIDYNGQDSYLFVKRLNPANKTLDWKIVSVVSLDQLTEEAAHTRRLVYYVSIILLLWSAGIIILVTSRLSGRIRTLSRKLGEIRKGHFGQVIQDKGKDEISEMSHTFNLMSIRLKELVEEVFQAELDKKELELKQKQAELKALQSQINPHFLFNTMESIRTGVLRNKDTSSAEKIELLAKLFRKTLNWQGDFVTLREELDFVDGYIKLQQIRFKDKITYDRNVDPTAGDCLVPKFIIQPLVENAVIHGIEPCERNCTIRLTVSLSPGVLKITVEDDGMGIPPEKLKEINEYRNQDQSGIGLQNVQDRIRILHGPEHRLYVKSAYPGGTTVVVSIPLKEAVPPCIEP